MRFLRPITIGAVLALAQLSAYAGQIAVLRNGFTIHFDHKEQSGSSTRLYTGTGYLDIASDQIASYDVDETPFELVLLRLTEACICTSPFSC